MTAMPPPTAYPRLRPQILNKLGHFVWPAAATIILHAAVLAFLLGNWSPQVRPVASQTMFKTQLVTINTIPVPEPSPAPLPEPPAPVSEPLPTPPPVPTPPPEVSTPEPVEPQIDHAAIARKRAEENERLERAREAERQRQKQARIEEQQRLEEQQMQEQERLEALAAEQARQEAQVRAEQQSIADARKKAATESLSQYRPISKQPPAYPKRALDRRTEGDCTVEYTVTAQGRVEDPVVVDGGCDDMIFARPSLASAKSFHYKPRVVNGVAVAVPGVRNTFRFRLEQ